MRIGEFARQAGVSPRSLRHYEEAGLLVPARTSAGYRDYSPKDLDAVARIRPILATGLGVAAARRYLTASRSPVMIEPSPSPCAPTCAASLRRSRRGSPGTGVAWRASRTPSTASGLQLGKKSEDDADQAPEGLTDVTGLARPRGGRRRAPLLPGDRLCPSTRKHE